MISHRVERRASRPSTAAASRAGRPALHQKPKGANLKGIEVPYHRGLHRFAVFTACATLVLVVAGALVTSNDAGLSLPDWPTTFCSFYAMPHMVGRVEYQHSHRILGEALGL